MVAFAWPFDSCGGFFFFAMLLLAWLLWSIGSVAKDTIDVAKKIASNEAVHEAGKGIFATWLDSVFNKR